VSAVAASLDSALTLSVICISGCGGGLFALVDEEDFFRLSLFRWFASRPAGCRSPYAVRTDGRSKIAMHREILRAPLVDHVNGNTLDNRRQNLRAATVAQNLWNRGKPLRRGFEGQASGYIGVHRYKRTDRWIARISVNGRRLNLGVFADPAEAARAFDRVAREHRGEYARLNFPEYA